MDITKQDTVSLRHIVLSLNTLPALNTELENETLKLAELLASKSPFALMAGKRGIYALQDVSYHEGIDYMSELFAGLCATEDAEEGVKAFIERRKPLWKMK